MHLSSPNFRTQAEADAQYNPSLPLVDPAAPLRHYTQRAEEARRRLRCTLGVPFGPTPQETRSTIEPAREISPATLEVAG